MRENTLKAIWARGGAVVNGWLAIPSAFSAEVMAHQGFDSLTIDMQHGVVDYQVAVTMLQAIATTPVIPLARVPWNDPGRLMKILDAGVYGVICPMINTRAEAEALVAACKYPPRGYRSWGPVRASLYAGADYGDHANQDLLVIPMIETAEALKNLDAILSVPGVDAVYVGPSDLSLALGCKPRLDQTDPPVVEAQERIVEACKRHGVVAGIHNNTAAYALTMIEAGYQFVTLASDSRFLAARAGEEVTAVRKSATKAGRLMKILDAGVYGVICPMINTRAEAEALVAACKYPPRGYRSWGPVRASIYAGADYGDRANPDLLVMPMIETAEALKNLDEILSVPGVDAVYVGPSDLSLALGCKPRLDQTDPPVVEAQQRIVEACRRHGVVAGIHNNTAAYALTMIEAGYRFVTLASDARFLAARAGEEVTAVRKSATQAGRLPAY